MRRIFIFVFLLLLCSPALADRNQATVTAYNSSALVKTGEGRIYSISFVATSNNGGYVVYDGTAPTGGSGSDISAVKAEGKEATSGNSNWQDYSNKPIEFHTGLYLQITTGYAIIEYE